jgi:hypothetical protein
MSHISRDRSYSISYTHTPHRKTQSVNSYTVIFWTIEYTSALILSVNTCLSLTCISPHQKIAERHHVTAQLRVCHRSW